MEGGDIEVDEDDPSSLDDLNTESKCEDPQMSTSRNQDELEVFREEWREELRRKQQLPSPEKVVPSQQSREEEAVSMYWMGAAAEKSGDMQAALLYYKRACQLVPDIDFKLNREQPPQEVDDDGYYGNRGNEEDKDTAHDLVLQFQTLCIQSQRWCEAERPAKGTHISSLPLDMMRYILRWVVSSQLDMRSLEQLSMVCRSLYCLSREPLLWRMACRKLWKDVTSAIGYGDSWRRMFLLRPHLHFNGVYICKTSYVREGERSLDQFYKPYHTVVYYRYLRFFPDGCVMYQTSPEDPVASVTRLCHKHSSESVMLGEYSHSGGKLVVDVCSHTSHSPHTRHKGRGGRGKRQESMYEQRFHMELVLQSSSGRHRCNQLTWKDYYCQSLHKPTGHIQTSHFNLDYTYSPFYFSRVKSYTINSTGLLA